MIMKEYSVVTIIWEDHLKVDRSPLPKDPDESIETTLSIGIIVDETEKVIVLASDIERYADRDECSYLIVFKSTILAVKEYGKVKINKIRKH